MKHMLPLPNLAGPLCSVYQAACQQVHCPGQWLTCGAGCRPGEQSPCRRRSARQPPHRTCPHSSCSSSGGWLALVRCAPWASCPRSFLKPAAWPPPAPSAASRLQQSRYRSMLAQISQRACPNKSCRPAPSACFRHICPSRQPSHSNSAQAAPARPAAGAAAGCEPSATVMACCADASRANRKSNHAGLPLLGNPAGMQGDCCQQMLAT